MAIELPTPACELGYPGVQVIEIFGMNTLKFYKWMRGKSITFCDGYTYNEETEEYEPSGEGPHGHVYYASDVEAYAATLPA
jgi:hypothetical protein